MTTDQSALQPLGPTIEPGGVHFSVFSEHATHIDLCLFDRVDQDRESDRIALAREEGNVWHASVDGSSAGQLYAYRARGPMDPSQGHRFDGTNLLFDPYARAIAGEVDVIDISRRAFPKCIAYADRFDWADDARPQIPWSETILYECHVKGMTMRHPDVPNARRGRYLGLTAPAIIGHLKALGVTTVELLPVQHHVTELSLRRRNLTNYWGYNTIGFFAPDPRFGSGATGDQVIEFKQTVHALHAANIEVILDVVYNHTAEGDESGPTLSFRGLDNRAYYLLDPNDRSRYLNFTGCGNTLNLTHPQTRRMVLDSLRYWAEEMHVDGFRFDLAPALLRNAAGEIVEGGLFDAIRTDPLLSRLKLIVEPWDAYPDGHRLGRFGNGFHEWNDRYRDAVRRFWRGDKGMIGEFATRVAGSDDVFAPDCGPLASINYLASHDGFTLNDLVSYEKKHNQANGEENADGSNTNYGGNFGVEGPADQPEIRINREKAKRALLAILAVSQGVPMISMGDELGRTQFGNNNAYCQDREEFWMDWSLDAPRQSLLEFARRGFQLRRAHAAFRRASFFTGEKSDPDGWKDVIWLRGDGKEMTADDWKDANRKMLGMLVPEGDLLLLIINAAVGPERFHMPRDVASSLWHLLLDSSGAMSEPAEQELRIPPRTLCLWKCVKP